MHLILATRGNKTDVDNFITQLQGQYLPTNLKFPKDKELRKYFLQVLVRPIQLWDLGFAQEHLDLLLNSFNPVKSDNKRYSKMQAAMSLLRKSLGVKKIPEDYDKSKILPFSACIQNTDIIPIGIKEDEFMDKSEQI